MRIIAGAWRGRRLEAPPGQATRPTSDRAREGLFSMLQSRLGSFEGLAVADLFAGTGALGLEALSRGAGHCTFYETDREALEALRGNIATLGAEAKAEVRPYDAKNADRGPWHLVFLDPPYGTFYGHLALQGLLMREALAPGAIASLETAVRDPVELPRFAVEAEKLYGKAKITLLRAP